MKMRKGYCVSMNGSPNEDYTFFNEDDRNEMLLALYEELIYVLWIRLLNWYDIDDADDAVGLALENLFIYDTMVVED